jgi:shikimate kinase
MQVRAPLYEEAADLVVETDARKVKSVVDEIERRLAEARGT